MFLTIMYQVSDLCMDDPLICIHKVSLREPELGVWRIQIWSSLHETVL